MSSPDWFMKKKKSVDILYSEESFISEVPNNLLILGNIKWHIQFQVKCTIIQWQDIMACHLWDLRVIAWTNRLELVGPSYITLKYIQLHEHEPTWIQTLSESCLKPKVNFLWFHHPFHLTKLPNCGLLLPTGACDVFHCCIAVCICWLQ